MLTAVERTVHAIAFVLQIIPVGTNRNYSGYPRIGSGTKG